jgi:hypothetical protein
MAADYTAYETVLKEVWTADRLETQFYNENPFLDTVEKDSPSYSIGDKAIVPVHTGRSGGYSVVPRSGSAALNAADEQKVTEATFTWTHHWHQIQIESNTIDETSGKAKAVASVVDTEVNGAIDDMRKQITRQFLGGNGDALIAQCGTTAAANEVELAATGAGYDAIVRGWLYPGLPVDIGTTSDENTTANSDSADSLIISAVEESATTPSITVSSAITTGSTDYVSIAGARSGATSYEANGLLNIVGTGNLGGITVSSTPSWQAASVDSTAQDLTLPLLYAKQRQVNQKTGKSANWSVTSLKQQENLYKLLQVQARFDGDRNLGAGNVGGVNFAGMKVDAQPDVRDKHWFFLTKEDLFLLRDSKPDWAPRKYGSGGILEWKQGSTALVSALVWRVNLCPRRRNSHAALTGLN